MALKKKIAENHVSLHNDAPLMVLDSELLLCSVVPIRLPRVSKILNRETRYSIEKNVKYVSRLGGDIGFDHTDVHACKLFFFFFFIYFI